MAFDGIMMRALCHEFNTLLQGAKVDKVLQPERDEFILVLRVHDKQANSTITRKLLLSANPSAPRICLTQQQKENPAVPPKFCMLLRKHLQSAKFVSAEQPGLERVIVLNFMCKTELFETVTKKLIIEVMGRCSNIIFTDTNGRIYEAVRQTDLMAKGRTILPGVNYELPPRQDKIDISMSVCSLDKVMGTGIGRLDKFLTSHLLGVSPLIAREIVYRCTGRTDINIEEMTSIQKEECKHLIYALSERICRHEYSPTFLFAEKPIEYYCMDIQQYGNSAEKQCTKTCSEALELFYHEKAMHEYLHRVSADVLKVLSVMIARISRKIEAQRGELRQCDDAEKYKLYGDLITANLYQLQRGVGEVKLLNYYDKDLQECTISLDPMLSPVQNAQHYYKLYKKAQTARDILNQQIPKAIKELAYLKSVFEFTENAESVADISQIRQELVLQGYLQQHERKNNTKKETNLKITEFCSADGFTILAGKNNLQNDYITFKMAEKQDIWFHLKNYSGSHVLVLCKGENPPDTTLTQAAIIAATIGKRENIGKVEVDYTEIKNVKKPSGAKPGMVTYDKYKTAVVAPDQHLVRELIVKK